METSHHAIPLGGTLRGLISDLIYLIVIGSLLLISCKEEQAKLVLTPEEWQWLAQNEKIRLGSDPFFAPISFIDENGKHSGYTRDIFRLIEDRLNIKFTEINAESWDDLLTMCKTKNCDLVGGIHKTPSRQKYLSYTQPYIDLPAVVIVPKSNKNI